MRLPYFHGMAEVFNVLVQLGFSTMRSSIKSSVLEISSSGNVVHASIGGFRVSSDATRIKMKNLCYQGCHFGYRQGLSTTIGFYFYLVMFLFMH